MMEHAETENEREVRDAAQRANAPDEKNADVIDRFARPQTSRTEKIEALLQEVQAIADHVTTLPIKNSRSAEEIIGYDEYGVPR